MWWFIANFIMGIWAVLDAKKRREKLLLPGLTFIFGALVLPIYIAKRNLKSGEVREGGFAWNLCKNFAIYWSVVCAIALIYFMALAGSVETADEFEEAGAAIGAGLGMGFIFLLWILGSLPSLILGLLVKKSSIIEKGPTGALFELGEADYKLSNLINDASSIAQKTANKIKN